MRHPNCSSKSWGHCYSALKPYSDNPWDAACHFLVLYTNSYMTYSNFYDDGYLARDEWIWLVLCRQRDVDALLCDGPMLLSSWASLNCIRCKRNNSLCSRMNLSSNMRQLTINSWIKGSYQTYVPGPQVELFLSATSCLIRIPRAPLLLPRSCLGCPLAFTLVCLDVLLLNCILVSKKET